MAQHESWEQLGPTEARPIRKSQRSYQRWRPEDVDLLRELYPDSSNQVLARRLKRSLPGVISMAFKLGLKKNPDRLTAMGRANIAKRWKCRRKKR